MKKRLSICLEENLIKKIDYLCKRIKRNHGGSPSRSSIIEHYLREPKSIVEVVRKLRAEDSRRKARVLI